MHGRDPLAVPTGRDLCMAWCESSQKQLPTGFVNERGEHPSKLKGRSKNPLLHGKL